MSKTINAGRVTFVPKDNFSNNISYKKFDIVTYNGSSYFAKKDTIGHTPTEEEFWQLVAEKGQNGEPGAVKMQVVDTLPETGQTDTIYLVKKDNPGEQNLYDEYIYTETGWEHIGDTSVDLSDYYTKEESDEKIFDSLPILYTSVANGGTTTKESDIKSASEVVNTLYKNGKKMFVYHNYYYNVPDVILSFPQKILKGNSRYDAYGCYNETGYAYIAVIRGFCVYINGTWDNEVFTCTSLQTVRSNDAVKAVNVASTITDTTTDPVQGKVVKKYVDDAVANINIPMYTITTTKSFMDNYINFETDVINKMTEIVNKNLDTGFELYIVDMYGGTFRFDIQMGTPSDASNTSTSVIGYGLGRQFYNKVRRFIVQYSAKDGLYTFSQFRSDGTQTVTFNNEVLTKDNTDVYTPTGNYNPATKKYVDDTISAKGGDKLHDYNIYTITLDDYNLKGTFPTITDATTLAKFDEILTDIYKKRISANAIHENAFLIVYSNSDTFIFRISTIEYSYSNLYGTYIEEPINYNGYTCSYQFNITGTLDKTAQTFKTTKVKFNRNSKRVLLTNNTLSYTPTDDYNPSTKLYTDKTHYENMTGYDATKTQVLKNINGTLTWVNE